LKQEGRREKWPNVKKRVQADRNKKKKRGTNRNKKEYDKMRKNWPGGEKGWGKGSYKNGKKKNRTLGPLMRPRTKGPGRPHKLVWSSTEGAARKIRMERGVGRGKRKKKNTVTKKNNSHSEGPGTGRFHE